MRHFPLLSDESLETLSTMLEGAELGGHLPRQIERVLIDFPPMTSGGFRQIGLPPSLYRLWGRVRRPMALAWAQPHSRAYFAAGQHAGATYVVWKQAVLAETGVR